MTPDNFGPIKQIGYLAVTSVITGLGASIHSIDQAEAVTDGFAPACEQN